MLDGRPILVMPDLEKLSGYEAALAKGWSPDPRRIGDTGFIEAELQDLRNDPAAYLDKLMGRHASAGQQIGDTAMALTNHTFWIWDGEFCGRIDLRYLPVTWTVPDGIPGHVGYSVVPWKQGRGYATAALDALLQFAKSRGLSELDILCNEENVISRAVIERVGGQLVRRAPHPSDRPEQQKLFFKVPLI
ncbi:MAG: GNAT family N-acetyltransferase [Rhizobium sp.]|jgi:predicted acetyltransferase